MSTIDWTTIRTDYESGMSLRQLAAKYNVSKSSIGEHKHKEQWDKQPGHRTATRALDTGQAQLDAHPTPEKSLGTKEAQRLFLKVYARHANVMLSAREAGVHRSTIYDWLEKDEDFSFAYHQAKEDAKDVLRAEIYRRAVEGWEEPVFQLGMFAGTVRKYDTTLLIFHSKMLMPEYRDKQQDININNVNLQMQRNETYANLHDDELDQLENLWNGAQERLNRGGSS
jgi:predicted DNA-binding protein YlxM (UPF0122 family)